MRTLSETPRHYCSRKATHPLPSSLSHGKKPWGCDSPFCSILICILISSLGKEHLLFVSEEDIQQEFTLQLDSLVADRAHAVKTWASSICLGTKSHETKILRHLPPHSTAPKIGPFSQMFLKKDRRESIVSYQPHILIDIETNKQTVFLRLLFFTFPFFFYFLPPHRHSPVTSSHSHSLQRGQTSLSQQIS